MAPKFTPGSSINFGSLWFAAEQVGDLVLLGPEHHATMDQAEHRLLTTPVQGLHVIDGKSGHTVVRSIEYELDSSGSPKSYMKSDPIYNTAAYSESDSVEDCAVYMADGASTTEATIEEIAIDAERERQRAEQLAK
jgi:hypothetical protein